MLNCDLETPLKFLGRRVAQQSADTELLVKMLYRQRQAIYEESQRADRDSAAARECERKLAEVASLCSRGSDYVFAMHVSAHTGYERGIVPSLSVLNRWRGQATAVTSTLATSDPQWYAKFWSDVFASGYNVPASVRRELRIPG